MTMAIISVLATLLVVLALSWNRFTSLGWGRALRMGLIWAAIILGMTLVASLLGHV